MHHRGVRTFATIATAALVGSLIGPLAPAAAEETGSYIVLTSGASAAQQKADKLRSAKAPVGRQFRHAVDGFAAKLTPTQVRQLEADPSVQAVVPDTKIKASAPKVRAASQQSGATWGLDRIDARTGDDGQYVYDTTGRGVTAYVIDSGIRMDHREFGGRAISGWDFVDADSNASDCPSNYRDDPSSGRISHGTHVAGTVAGATYGVAKQISITSLRVLDCDGTGTASAFIAALDWVVAQHPKNSPSVVNVSLGGPRNTAMNLAVAKTVRAGVPVIVAAGNESDDACYSSPASAPEALTVGATDAFDEMAWFSNSGKCVDLLAPGDGITSAGTLTPTAALEISGTSMATPHVTGVVARYLQSTPKASPAQVTSAVIGETSRGVLDGPLFGSPNRLLFSGFPTKATSVTSSRSDKSKTVTLKWSAPVSNGGFAISGYQIVRSGKDAAGTASATVNVGPGVRSYTFSKLKAGTSYTLTVRARNSRALGVPSTSKVTITALPGKPKITSVKSGSTKDKKTSVSVKWSKPKSGGSVKNYVITATRTATGSVKTVTVSSKARSATVKGLKKNKSYLVRVRATNDSGKGSSAKWSRSVKAR